MKKLFTEYWQEFDVQYIKNMYGAELPLLYFLYPASDSTVKADVSVSAGQSGAGKADYRKIPFQGGTAYDGVRGRHGSGGVYDAGRTVLVSSYFME